MNSSGEGWKARNQGFSESPMQDPWRTSGINLDQMFRGIFKEAYKPQLGGNKKFISLRKLDTNITSLDPLLPWEQNGLWSLSPGWARPSAKDPYACRLQTGKNASTSFHES